MTLRRTGSRSRGAEGLGAHGQRLARQDLGKGVQGVGARVQEDRQTDHAIAADGPNLDGATVTGRAHHRNHAAHHEEHMA